jgi:hypothetical protein
VGVITFGTFVVGYAVAAAVGPGPNPETFASLGSMWFVMALCYLIVVSSYGAEVRLETPDSGFPPRFFLLPVRTSVLVGWPMLQGVLAAVLAWVIWDHCVLRPCGIETPFWWGAMLAAVVATTQALMWVPFGLAWVRLPVAIVVLTALIRAPAILALADERFANPETVGTTLTALAAGLIPVVFLLARAGVGRARRGDSPDWLRGLGSVRRPGEPGEPLPPFASALRAQVWYEWRLRGRGFPLLVLFALAVLMAWGVFLEQNKSLRTEYSAALLFTPVPIAAFCGSPFARCSESPRSPRRAR